jgi:hypothetical protein
MRIQLTGALLGAVLAAAGMGCGGGNQLTATAAQGQTQNAIRCGGNGQCYTPFGYIDTAPGTWEQPYETGGAYPDGTAIWRTSGWAGLLCENTNVWVGIFVDGYQIGAAPATDPSEGAVAAQMCDTMPNLRWHYDFTQYDRAAYGGRVFHVKVNGVPLVHSGESHVPSLGRKCWMEITRGYCSGNGAGWGGGEDYWGEEPSWGRGGNFNAAFDEGSCFGRANDYHYWCGVTAVVRAHFDPDGEAHSSNGCYVYIYGSCHPDPNNFSTDLTNQSFDDTWGENNVGAGWNQDACADRARQYRDWCRYSPVVETIFGPNGNQTWAF